MKSRQAQEYIEAHGAELIAAYEAGASLRALAGRTGINPDRIRDYLASQGVAIRVANWQSREAFEARGADLIAAYEAGTPLSVLADSAGISTRALGKFLAAQGVRLRHDRGWYRRRRNAGG